jgi:hypothetical protein
MKTIWIMAAMAVLFSWQSLDAKPNQENLQTDEQAPQAQPADTPSKPVTSEAIPDAIWTAFSDCWKKMDEKQQKELEGVEKPDPAGQGQAPAANLKGFSASGSMPAGLTDEQLAFIGEVWQTLDGAGIVGKEFEHYEIDFLKRMIKSRLELHARMGRMAYYDMEKIVQMIERQRPEQLHRAGSQYGFAMVEYVLITREDLSTDEVHEELRVALEVSGLISPDAGEWKKRRLTDLVVALGSGLPYPAVATLTDELKAEIESLIAQLGNDDYDTREEATQRLIEIGPAAFPFLKTVAESEDADISARARQILGE